MTLAERFDKLALEAERLRTDAEFRESLITARGHLTMSHVSLASARLSARRAMDAIDRVSVDYERLVANEEKVA